MSAYLSAACFTLAGFVFGALTVAIRERGKPRAAKPYWQVVSAPAGGDRIVIAVRSQQYDSNRPTTTRHHLVEMGRCDIDDLDAVAELRALAEERCAVLNQTREAYL